jgi:hypothetical protein
MSRASSYYWDNLALARLLDATDPKVEETHLMQLSTSDSEIIKKWMRLVKDRKENPDEYQNL